VPGSIDTSNSLAVQVAKDRLAAWIELKATRSPGFVPPTVTALLKTLEQARIAISDDVRRRVEELVVTLARATPKNAGAPLVGLPERVVVAEGRAAVEAEDGRLEWAPGLAPNSEKPDHSAAIDYFSRCLYVNVPAGAPLGRIVPPHDGTPGVDVYGHAQAPRKPQGAPLGLGPGVRLAEPGSDQLVAEIAGRVVIEGGRVRVREQLEIPGDVDFTSGSIEAAVDVLVHGAVRAKPNVHTTASLHVKGVIEAANIDVGGDVTVGGGIFGHECSGRVRAAGSITAKLLNEADVEVRGDVNFTKEILNSRVRARGRIVGESGTIIGGETYAREGLAVRVLGSEACIATEIATGTDINALRRVRQAERQIRELEKSRHQVQLALRPLAADRKRLVPTQRAHAAELLVKMNAINLQIDGQQQLAARILRSGAPRGTPSVLVSETAYSGTRIRIQAHEARLRGPLHGPVRIELRKVKDVTEIAAIHLRTGAVTVLPSGDVDLDAPPTDEPTRTETSHERDERTTSGGGA
jgi:uncharacterized protein